MELFLIEKWKPSQVPLVDLFRGIQLTVLGSMVEPYSQICGAVVIIDMEGNKVYPSNINYTV